jgi:GT2 family glycosyltransferase
MTDDDCIPDQHWVSTIAHTFAGAHPPDAMTGRVLPFGPDAPGLYSVSLRENTDRVEYSGKTIPWLVGTGANFAMKRAWSERVGLFDERLGAGTPGKAAEDADYFYRLLCSGARIRYEPEAIIYHERQSWKQRMESRLGYGHGIGVFCSIYWRRGDHYSLRILHYWLRSQGKELLSAGKRFEWLEAYQRLLGVRGMVRGFVHGLQVGSNHKMASHT